ncbi:MAG TPA: hypothetical protein VG939_05295 [Caulobacteraceae bacterium]|nr:hypothetical protein [Caulobacteraceae bacterium]
MKSRIAPPRKAPPPPALVTPPANESVKAAVARLAPHAAWLDCACGACRSWTFH